MQTQRRSTLPRAFLAALAIVFACAMVLYSCVWMYAIRHQTAPVELGIDTNYIESAHVMEVLHVYSSSPAERAGLRPHDRIVAVNGKVLGTAEPFSQVWWRSRPGDLVHLSVARRGQQGLIGLQATFRAARGQSGEGLARASATEVTRSFPVLFLIVGLAVLFLRLDDPHAWLLALLFGGFIAAPPRPLLFSIHSELLRSFVLAYRAIFISLLGPLFYFFFSVFPARSPLDRRFPWLKWLAFAPGVVLAVFGLAAGEPRAPALLYRMAERATIRLQLGYVYGFFALGIISLVVNAATAPSPAARRKMRIILWGIAAGVLPTVVERAAIDFFRYRPPFWLDTLLVINLFLFPLSFAYAVLKYRVLEIPVLLKRSARYVLVRRGLALLAVALSTFAILGLNSLFSMVLRPGSQTTVTMALASGLIFGTFLSVAGREFFKRGSQRIDRAFFRGAYDARNILQDLAAKARTVANRHELALSLERHIREALHPKSLAGYFESGPGCLALEFGGAPAGFETLSATLPVLTELGRRGKSWNVPPPDSREDGEMLSLAPLAPECLVPILGRDSRLGGFLALGERLSEEPYSGEDRELLDSVASQAGLALESFRMAESIAERIEIERRSAYELDIGRKVQARLFPQKNPPLRTLEYAGGCIQARSVGGDYYDFLDLSPGRVGIVLADISGKGISGALLMANLQANLRSQYAVALDDLPRLLESVNRLFYENSPVESYATLFFADYDDAARRVRYANCGHNPPLLLRAAGAVERLEATATVVGLFPQWECGLAEVSLEPGDVLVMYTDGISEAPNDAGDEFGEERLIETVRKYAGLPVDELLAHVQNAVQEYSAGEQADDLTLVIGRVR